MNHFRVSFNPIVEFRQSSCPLGCVHDVCGTRVVKNADPSKEKKKKKKRTSSFDPPALVLSPRAPCARHLSRWKNTFSSETPSHRDDITTTMKTTRVPTFVRWRIIGRGGVESLCDCKKEKHVDRARIFLRNRLRNARPCSALVVEQLGQARPRFDIVVSQVSETVPCECARAR